jgi:hypothetical protein
MEIMMPAKVLYDLNILFRSLGERERVMPYVPLLLGGPQALS